jgi:hypothetical protein
MFYSPFSFIGIACGKKSFKNHLFFFGIACGKKSFKNDF